MTSEAPARTHERGRIRDDSSVDRDLTGGDQRLRVLDLRIRLGDLDDELAQAVMAFPAQGVLPSGDACVGQAPEEALGHGGGPTAR
jgi:hypothetical protein